MTATEYYCIVSYISFGGRLIRLRQSGCRSETQQILSILFFSPLLLWKTEEIHKGKVVIMKEYSPDAYYRRVNEVNAINAHAYDRSISALRRDKWLFEPILKNNPNIPKLTEEQIREVEEFWRPYEFAYKNDYRQQEMFTGISGKFDPSYFGFGLQRHLMVSFWNHESFKWIGEKNFAPLYFPEAKMPVVDSLGDEFLEYVKDGMNIIIQEDGKVLVSDPF